MRLLLLVVLLGGPAAASQEDDAQDKLRATVEQLGWDLTDECKVPAVAVTLFRSGKVAWFLGCGYADMARGTEVN